MRESRNVGPLVDWLQTAVRQALVPLERIADLVPDGGHVLELGCGQGLLIDRISRRVDSVTGVDIDARKCRMANAALAGRSNVKIVHGELIAFLSEERSASVSTVILSDTLSSLPRDRQEASIRLASRCLERGGLLLVKHINTQPAWKSNASRLVSGIIYGVLGLSISYNQGFSYLSSGEYAKMLRRVGLRTVKVNLSQSTRQVIPHSVVMGWKP